MSRLRNLASYKNGILPNLHQAKLTILNLRWTWKTEALIKTSCPGLPDSERAVVGFGFGEESGSDLLGSCLVHLIRENVTNSSS